MLIRAHGATLNVTQVVRIVVDRDVEEVKTKTGWFGSTTETRVTYSCTMLYKNADGKEAEFKWQGASTRAQAEEVEKELLRQIREVELEHMSTALEEAIIKNG